MGEECGAYVPATVEGELAQTWLRGRRGGGPGAGAEAVGVGLVAREIAAMKERLGMRMVIVGLWMRCKFW